MPGNLPTPPLASRVAPNLERKMGFSPRRQQRKEYPRVLDLPEQDSAELPRLTEMATSM